MKQRIVELFLIAFSAFVIIDGDWVYETLFPDAFWKQRVAILEKRERRDLWRVHREEWHLKQARLELSFALSAARDEAQCLMIDSDLCVARAKEPYIVKIQEIEQELESARLAYEQSQQQLESARLRTTNSP